MSRQYPRLAKIATVSPIRSTLLLCAIHVFDQHHCSPLSASVILLRVALRRSSIVVSTAENPDAASGVFDDGEDVVGGTGHRGGGEEVAGHDGVGLTPEERWPGGVVTVRGGLDPRRVPK